MTEQDAALKPCPFCGGGADLQTYQTESLWSHNIVTYTQVGCSECDYSFATEMGYEMEAPERWNTRAPDPRIESLSAEVERLREVLKRWQYSGCPDCGGDCGSANPPMSCCIMQETSAALEASSA